MTRKLAEVARKVGVSEATVSRVLNGKAGVSDSTRQAVLTAIDVLGYERPTHLRGVRARLIGIVVPELQNPIFPVLAEAVGGALVQLGFTPVLCTRAAGGLSEAEYVTMLLDQHVSGVVFCGGLTPEENSQLLQRGLPVVLLNAAVDHAGFPQVATDDTAAIQQAFAHLYALGHRDIGLLVGPADHGPSAHKTAAFEAACRGQRLNPADRVGNALFSFEGGQAAAAELIHAGATALVCGSDVLALGAIRAARQSGLKVPDEFSVVGFDDSALMNYTDPPLTTLRQPIDTMARAAAQLLLAQIDGSHQTSRQLLHAPELVVRGSTAVCPTRPRPLAPRHHPAAVPGSGARTGAP